MARNKLNRTHQAHADAAAYHLHQMGANHQGGTFYKAADSLGDQIQAVSRAVSAISGMDTAGDMTYVEEVFDAYVIICVCSMGDAMQYFKATYSTAEDGSVTLQARDGWVEVEEVWTPVQASAAKAGAPLDVEDTETVYATVKALGDRTLELRVAWGYDGHQEQFHPERTDFDVENFPTPPVAYYHGYTDKGKKAPKPVFIGRTIKRENRTDGHYITAKLNNKPEANKVWDAALKGDGFVSPGTVGHLIRKDPDGTLTYWPIAEISAWDGAPQRKQAHPQSIAFPVLKALYQEAGLDIPAIINPPETGGDPVSAGADIPDDEAGRILIAEISKALLHARK